MILPIEIYVLALAGVAAIAVYGWLTGPRD